MASRGFTSDNAAGMHPRVLAWLARANTGHADAYGADPYTAQVEALFKAHFGEQTTSYLVMLGTAANVLSLQAVMQPWHAVLCTDQAHLHESECNAPEKHTGGKVITIPHDGQGKLTPNAVLPHLRNFGFVHAPQPRVISITQCTEYGTLYSPDEVRALAQLAHAHDMVLHMDGARLANAAAALGLPFRAFTVDCGVDILSFGGTKNGLLGAEAILVFNSQLATQLPYIRKQGMQLVSKMRFLAAQFLAYFEDDLWLEMASHANGMAQHLATQLSALPHIDLTRTVQTNGVFARISPTLAAQAQAHYPFLCWDERIDEYRFMCSWDTQPEDIDGVVKLLAANTGS